MPYYFGEDSEDFANTEIETTKTLFSVVGFVTRDQRIGTMLSVDSDIKRLITPDEKRLLSEVVHWGAELLKRMDAPLDTDPTNN